MAVSFAQWFGSAKSPAASTSRCPGMSRSGSELADRGAAASEIVVGASSGTTPVAGVAASGAQTTGSGASAASAAEIAVASGPLSTLGLPPPEPLLLGIARLKAEQAELRAHRKRISKDLKNAEKRRSRLKKRARQLSDGDLVAVLQMREAQSASSAAENPGSAAASSSSAASSSAGSARPSTP